MESKRLRVRLVRSVIGSMPRQRKTVVALGLHRIDSVVVKPDNPAIRGMIQRVSHLVSTEEVEE